MSALLEVDGLTKRFGGVTAVDSCSFAVPEGSITALVGPNGSGKTTAFNLITGYARADAGSVRFAGATVPRPDPIRLARRGLTRTFQQARIFGELTLVQNMVAAVQQPWRTAFAAAVRAGERARALEFLEDFGLAGLAQERAGNLSYGQKKLLEFAAVLMAAPRLVLLDEPTAGVNPVLVEQIEQRVRELNARGLTFLVVEHNMNLVMRLCDPIVVLDHGTKLADGHPDEVRNNPPRAGRVSRRMTALLDLEGVVAGYGRGDILCGIDLAVHEGKVMCLVGPNGAGKSTVLKTISGVLRPREGRVLFAGREISRLSPAQVLDCGIVQVAQDRSLFPMMTVWDNLLMGGHVLRDRALVRRRADAIVQRFPLVGERQGERACDLSGGQQKLVEIARALMLEPRLILLDEPTMGLDPKARHLIFELVARLNSEGRTLLLVEQNARAGLAIAHEGAVLDSGRIALTGPGPQLLEDPRVAQLYLGGAAE